MRCLARNKRAVWYSLYQGEVDERDQYGNRTGYKVKSYSAPVKVYMNISPARGTADIEQFGINTPYTHTLITDDLMCPITTTSLLWQGITPDGNGEDGTVKHNYAVISVAKSLNSITYAIAEVDAG